MRAPLLNSVVSARGLTKAFGPKVAVDGVDLDVHPGEIVGFLGPNGAGKTTVMSMITGLLEPDAGELSLFGVPGGARRPELRARIAFLQEKPRVYPEMSGRSYLRFFADLYAVPNARRRVDDLLRSLSLADAADRLLGTYSRGMQQRACLARCLLHEPALLVLDEPTLGLDPKGVADLRALFRELARTGVSLMFSSHQLAEMERVCDRVILMNRSRVVATGTREELQRHLADGTEILVEVAEASDAIVAALAGDPRVAAASTVGERRIAVRLRRRTDGDLLAARVLVSDLVARAGGVVLEVTAASVTLEELFLAMTGEPAAPLAPQEE